MLTLNRSTLPAMVAGACLLASVHANAAVLLGNPYRPTGAGYTITAVQNVNGADGTGGTNSGAQVNRDFEFNGTLGVAYTDSKNKVTQFGIGLYQNGTATLSTGLNVKLDAISSASSVSVTLADFDITTSATFFNLGKVASSVLVYGANNSVLFSADPTAVFKAMTPVTGQNDYWNLNFGTLLANAGQSSNSLISGFLLYADSTRGEKANSDPYFITSINGGIPMIPEPRTYVGGAVLVALLIFAHAKAVLKKKAETLS